MIHKFIEEFILCPDLYHAFGLYTECMKKIHKCEDAFIGDDTFKKITDKCIYPAVFFSDKEKNDFNGAFIYIVHITSLYPNKRDEDADGIARASMILDSIFSKYSYRN